ncbi:ATP-binding cassette domain-containing protein [Frigidibacter sp. RF13]|uniref:ATP-binding cassette domain-containing protein n=1 Tax=Frigidibacter sp. RF13 TaxID=2997340 RepID=UPI002270530C|nr:ATP-binding cassette domain-containing protein [Frigidibacter sp. RF13]MCY1128732.1 ATP-binding cassette domain-containing protein [Frigidibacter sp. RF13]
MIPNSIENESLADSVRSVSRQLSRGALGRKFIHDSQVLQLVADGKVEFAAAGFRELDAKNLSELRTPSVVIVGENAHLILKNDDTGICFADPTDETGKRAIPLSLGETSEIKVYEILGQADVPKANESVVHEKSTHWFWSKFRFEVPSLINVVLASLIVNTLAIVTSFFSLQVYDRVLPNRSLEALTVLLVGLIIAVLFDFVLKIIRASIMDRVGQKIEVQALGELLERIINLKRGPGCPSPTRLIHLTRDYSSVRELITEGAVGVATDLPFTFMFIAMIWLISRDGALVVLIGLGAMVAPSILFGRWVNANARNVQSQGAASHRLVSEAILGAETIQVTGVESFFADSWRKISRAARDATRRQRMSTAFFTQWSSFVTQIAQAGVVVACVFGVLNGELTVGAMVATTLLASRAMAPVVRLSTILMRWQMVSATLNELNGIVLSGSNRLPDRRILRPTGAGLDVAVDELGCVYRENDAPALTVRRLHVGPGERLALMGVSGSGKSTLLKLVCGQLPASHGSLRLQGQDIRNVGMSDIAANVGYLSQSVTLFSGSLRENVAFGDERFTDRDILTAIEKSGLGAFVRSRPEGLEYSLDEQTGGMSMGQRQCVGLARILLRDPRLVALDEPTANMDIETERMVVANLKEWLAGRTFIVATHRTPILALVDRIVVLSSGRVVLDGPRDEILRRIAAISKGEKA